MPKYLFEHSSLVSVAYNTVLDYLDALSREKGESGFNSWVYEWSLDADVRALQESLRQVRICMAQEQLVVFDRKNDEAAFYAACERLERLEKGALA